jgi:hypothetical protein
MRMLAAALVAALALPAVAAEAAASGAAPVAVAIPAAPAPRPPRPPLPPPPPPVAPAPEAYGKSSGLIPGAVIGPKLAIALPAPGFGVEAKIQNVFGLSFDYDLIPDVSLGSVTAGYRDFNVAAKWYPWRRAFFLGAALGRRSFEASATDDVSGVKASLEVESTYLAPEIGWRWVWNNGLFLGMDLGYQIILSSRTKLDIPSAGVSVDTTKDVTDAGDEIGEIGLPIVSLLQVGFFF